MINILHCSGPLCPRSTAQFYIGYARDKAQVAIRIAQHQRGDGARFTQVAVERGLTLTLVCLIDGNRTTERQLKRRKNTRKIVDRARRGTLRERVLWHDRMPEHISI